MMFQPSTALAALAFIATTAKAHMTMEFPVPYGQSTLNNSPLDNSGSDFPCKQRQGVYDVTKENQWNAGETKTVSFLGTAVHGGGSCQFSMTTDRTPSKNTQWKVIHSVIGNCPSDDPGNLSGGKKPSTFDITMPKDMGEGEYTFAWTWFNKVGNREMYMNCAPVTVGGGANKASDSKASTAALSKFPDMFVANIPRESCSTSENQDFVFPSPGDSVQTGTKVSLGNSLSGSGCAAMTKLGAGAGNLGSPAQASGGAGGNGGSAVASAPAATSAPAAAPSQPAASNPGGVFAPGASSAAGGAQTSFTTLLVTQTAGGAAPTAPAPAPTPSQGGTGVGAAPPTASGNCVPCTNDGGVVCIGSNQFGLCNRGCAVPQDVAAGMTCSNGAVVRRSVRRVSHVHRRHGHQMI